MYNIILFDKNNKCPVAEFLNSLDKKLKAKTNRDILLLEEYGTKIGMPYVKYIDKSMWELRTIFANSIVRILFIVDTTNIILLHGFVKKTEKTPRKEIDIAISRMKEYYNN